MRLVTRILLPFFLTVVLLGGCAMGPVSSDDNTDASSSLLGSCGGEGECEEHYIEYHNIPGALFPLFTQEALNAWVGEHSGERFTIVQFVRDMSIDKATFMEYMGITEENWDDYLPNTSIPDTIIAGEFVEAIYSGDEALIEKVFKRKEPVGTVRSGTASTD